MKGFHILLLFLVVMHADVSIFFLKLWCFKQTCSEKYKGKLQKYTKYSARLGGPFAKKRNIDNGPCIFGMYSKIKCLFGILKCISNL